MATTVTLKPNAIDLSGSTSGTTTLQPTAVAGTTTITLPAATDTLVGKATTDTLTNKTLTSPTLTTPVLGTPSSGTLTNCTGLPNAGLVNSSVTIGGTAIALGASSSTITNDLSISGLTVGKGGGAVSTNTAVGVSALAANTSGSVNTAIGYNALFSATTGVQNTAVGNRAVYSITTGNNNTGFGHRALDSSTGSDNTAVGSAALQSNTTGASNVAMGQAALLNNTTASNNTAVGYQAGYTNTTGNNIACFGKGAGYTNTTGTDNTLIGYHAGYTLNSGGNVALGSDALSSCTSGSLNTAVGYSGGNAITTGSKNTILGRYTGNQGGLDIRTASNYIVLSDGDGNPRSFIDGSGNAYFQLGGAVQNAVPSGINLTGPASTQLQLYLLKSTQAEAHFGYKSSTDTNLYVGTAGGVNGLGTYGLYQGNGATSWTAVSDERFKTELQPIENALNKISNVRAVTGRYIQDAENGITKRRPFLIAQDWVTALPEAVDEQDADKLGLSYSDTVPLLVAAIKELKTIVDTQAAEIAELKAKVA